MRKEKLAVINMVRCFVSLELREIDADELLIRNIKSLMDTKKHRSHNREYSQNCYQTCKTCKKRSRENACYRKNTRSHNGDTIVGHVVLFKIQHGLFTHGLDNKKSIVELLY